MTAKPSRRDLVSAGLLVGAAAALPRSLRAETAVPAAPTAAVGEVESHGLSTFGELKYPAGFKHFDYVNPEAPKGGSVSLQIESLTGNQNFNTFNTLNVYVLKGDGAAGMGFTFDSLMSGSADEPDGMYGLVAASVKASADKRVYRFKLRPQARFHDGSKLTAHDVAFSILTLRDKSHPRIRQVLREVEGVDAEADDLVAVRLTEKRSRDLPMTVAGLPIFSETYWKGRDFEASTLEPPLGSGAYKVGRFEAGRFIEFERVRDYWAKDLPVSVGSANFDRVRYEYFRDRQVAFEAFKAAAFTFREEFTSRDWATGYDFPAVRDGRVKREKIPDETPSGTQGWIFNTRRETLKDPRIREALGLAFDFEWTNQNIMFGSYLRTASYFENSDMKAVGPPSPEELALLEPFRGKVPDAVFGEPYMPPKSDGSGQDRALLRRAGDLLRQAGCVREGNLLKLPGGRPLELEFLDFSPSLQPHTEPLIKNLRLLGIEGRIRIVDAAQYQRRMDDFDFDITTRRTSMGLTPGESLKVMFGSEAAHIKGSANIAGIADPAVDALLDRIANAETRASLTTACRALDRVLRAGHYWIPMWYKGDHWLAYWDAFGKPPIKPKYSRGAPFTWWYDSEKAKRVGLPG